MFSLTEIIHEQYAKRRRINTLSIHFSQLIPYGATVLDVGTGDGLIAASVKTKRPDITIKGTEFQVRENCAITVEPFDGVSLPFSDNSFDYVSFVDVLHHSEEPIALLKDALRVARCGLIIKDHLRQGLVDEVILRFMDKIGNFRYGISLPYNYFSFHEWQHLFQLLNLYPLEWRESLNIYPKWVDFIFGRNLHFFARLQTKQSSANRILEYWHDGISCVNERWESAYKRFETPSEEFSKFERRFRKLSIDRLERDSFVVDLFCGRGNGLAVLSKWGFNNIAGVDLSTELLKQCSVPARLVVADCTDLRFEPCSVDAFIVQGGLHHLQRIPDDLEACLRAINQALKADGCLYIVEPWNTFYLKTVNVITRFRLVRSLYSRCDAFATMVEEEWETYHQWLNKGPEIKRIIHSIYPDCEITFSWGKCFIKARKNAHLDL